MTTTGATSGVRWLAVAVGLVVVYNPLVNEVIPASWYVPANVLFAALLVTIGVASGGTADQMGLRPERSLSGLSTGILVAAGVLLVVVVVAALPVGRSYLADDRFLDVGVGRMLYETLIRIPIGTALTEEVVFRGALLGLFLGRFSVRLAVVSTSLLFGLWHILPTLNSLETNPVGDILASPVEVVGAVLSAVLVTFLAGLVFCWLRLRSGSVVAPVVVHAVLNAAAYAAGWLVVSNGWST